MVLEQILAYKKQEVENDQWNLPLEILKRKMPEHQARPFAEGLRKPGEIRLIAEIKKASPSKGLIRKDGFDPALIAETYETAGAAAISVLTDEKFFQGSRENLILARNSCQLPILRKDFIVDAYQIYQAKYIGADAILLIMAALTDRNAKAFFETASALELDVLVEVHTEEELERALHIGAKLIGINNRDLKTFKTDIGTTVKLRKMITDPEITVVSESGINHPADVQLLAENHIHAMLVGESIMREVDMKSKINELLKAGLKDEN